MTSPCVGNTDTVQLFQDGAGILRGSVIPNAHVNNPLEVGTGGLVKRASQVRYGWLATGVNVADDYNTDLILTPGQGFQQYGPALVVSIESPSAIGWPWHVNVHIGWEIQAAYDGVPANNASGISYQLQVSRVSPVSWSEVATTSISGAASQTWRHNFQADWPIPADGSLYQMQFRMTVQAGNVGLGDNIVCNFTRHRYAIVNY